MDLNDCKYFSNSSEVICKKEENTFNQIPDLQIYGSKFSKVLINNKNISYLKNFAFKNSSIKHLDLAMNNIETISSFTFTFLFDLEILKLNNNKIKSVFNLAHSLCLNHNQNLNFTPRFYELDLSSNFLEYFDAEFSSYFESLRKLNLKSNKLKFIDENLFSNVQNELRLSDLDLSNNNLENLKEIFFPK